jgi:hypothetical protein
MEEELFQLAETAHAFYQTATESTDSYQVTAAMAENYLAATDFQAEMPNEPGFYAAATIVSTTAAGALRKFGFDEEPESVLED